MSGTYHTMHIDNYAEKKLTLAEVEFLIKVVEQHGLALTPISTNMGFDVGYAVILPNIAEDAMYCPPKQDPETIFKCIEDQLPKECTFTWMKKAFGTKRNTDLIAKLGMREIQDYGFYEY